MSPSKGHEEPIPPLVLESNDVAQPELVRRGHRDKKPSVLLRDYVTNNVKKMSPSPCSSAPSCLSGTPYPIAHFNCDNFSLCHRAFLAAVDAGIEPKHFNEAMKYPKWREAMQKELRALEDNET